MIMRILATLLLLSSMAAADVIDDIRLWLSQNNFAAAEAELKTYRDQHGADPAYLEALSWMGRGWLMTRDYARANDCARETRNLTSDLLKKRSLDAESHLPMALGAAYEVEAQALAEQGKDAQAVALLQAAIRTYGNTSIKARLEKNLNLLKLPGKPAPPLHTAEYFGPAPSSLAQLKGSPVLLFFWAHWCSDCKAEGPIITQLRSEFAAKGLKVMAPTQRYGYAARGEDASPQAELTYIKQVWQHFYSGLQDVSVPVSKGNFDTYGASTTPTLVLIDRAGHVAMYHPGAMPYGELRAAIEKVSNN
jgi:thiol-disulfide isomerase/thioredoxin